MEIKIFHEGYVYVVANDGNEIIMYKEDTEEWMGVTEYLKVFTIEGDTQNPVSLYRKLAKALHKVVYSAGEKWYMFNVTDEKRANIYERVGKSIKGYSCQRADKYFYLYKNKN